ncbi:MAG: ABC transporter substrate-binding protein [Pseudomonadota bacterium]
MKNLLTATAASALMASAAYADGHTEVKLGVFLGFTGPIESLVAEMGPAAELAIEEASASDNFLGGASVTSVRADTTCVDAGAATAAAERLITGDGVAGIVGGDCSGVTGAVLQNVALPNGMVMISPSATSPGLSHTNNEDNGLFFRTAPSDARQGVVMTEVLMDQGINEVAVTYTNNDYGKGLADAFQAAFEEAGGSITITAAHEDGKADYSAEVGALASAGGERLVVAGYVDQGGAGIVRAALDTGAFDTFHFPDGMIGEALTDTFGDEIDGSSGQHPSPSDELAAAFTDLVAGRFEATSPFAPESYDAAALILLAMQAAGSSDPAEYAGKVFDVANAPGEPIAVGELDKAFQILAEGGEIDYVGASGVELIGPGEAAGNYRQITVEGGSIETVQFR